MIFFSFDPGNLDIVLLSVGQGADRVILVLQTPVVTETCDRLVDHKVSSDRSGFAIRLGIIVEVAEAVGNFIELFPTLLYARKAHALQYFADIVFLRAEFQKFGKLAACGEALLPYFPFVSF